MTFLWKLIPIAAKHEFTVNIKHLAGINNSIADSLSRFQIEKFRQLAPKADPLPTAIPDIVWKISLLNFNASKSHRSLNPPVALPTRSALFSRIRPLVSLLRLFTTHLRQNFSYSNIKTYLVAVHHRSIELGFRSNFCQMPLLRLLLWGIKRVKGSWVGPKRLPTTLGVMKLLKNHLRESLFSIQDPQMVFGHFHQYLIRPSSLLWILLSFANNIQSCIYSPCPRCFSLPDVSLTSPHSFKNWSVPRRSHNSIGSFRKQRLSVYSTI